MAVSRIFKQQSFMITNDLKYGVLVKTIAEKLVAMSNGALTLHEIVSDTDTSFSAYYKVFDTPVLLQIATNNNAINFYFYQMVDDSLIRMLSFGFYFIPTTSEITANITIKISSLGNFLFGFHVSSDRYVGSSSYVQGSVLWGFCEPRNENMYFASSYFASSIALFDKGGSSMYALDITHTEVQEFSSMSWSPNSLISYSGNTYAMVDYILSCYNISSPEIIGKIKWGGLYYMYSLTSKNGYIKVVPGNYYVVDGVTYQAISDILSIPILAD